MDTKGKFNWSQCHRGKKFILNLFEPRRGQIDAERRKMGNLIRGGKNSEHDSETINPNLEN